MPSEADVHWLCARAKLVWTCAALVLLGLGACQVHIPDGVFACSTSADCPSGLQCDPQAARCARKRLGSAESTSTARSDGGEVGESAGAVAKDGGVAGHDAAMSFSDASTHPRLLDASRPGSPSADASGAAAGSGGRAQAAGASAAAADGGGDAQVPDASAAAGGGGAGSPPRMAADCPQNTYCYGFEAGALDPSGALWPSPSDGSGGLPAHGELTTAPFPAASGNLMLVSRPSSQDGWPKATVGFSGPRTAFSKLVVSFDYAAGDKLALPNPRVILFRFVGTPDRNGDSVNVGILDDNAMLEVQTDGPDPLYSIGDAAAPGVLTHVVATFARSPDACTVSIAYGALPLEAAAFPCDVEHWQIELGLDMVETPPEQYKDEYVAYFDNLQLSTSP